MLLKFIGLLPITVIDGKSVTKAADVIVPVLSISLGVFISYVYFIRKEDLFTSKSDIANFGNFISFVTFIWVSIISMVSSFIFRHKTWNIFKSLSATDGKVIEYVLLIYIFIITLVIISIAFISVQRNWLSS